MSQEYDSRAEIAETLNSMQSLFAMVGKTYMDRDGLELHSEMVRIADSLEKLEVSIGAIASSLSTLSGRGIDTFEQN